MGVISSMFIDLPFILSLLFSFFMFEDDYIIFESYFDYLKVTLKEDSFDTWLRTPLTFTVMTLLSKEKSSGA